MAVADLVETRPAETRGGPRPGAKLWWWFVALCLLQAAAWTAWFVVASRHHVETVPLVRVR